MSHLILPLFLVNSVHILKAQDCQYSHRKYHVSLKVNRIIVGVSTRIKIDTKDSSTQPVPIRSDTKDSSPQPVPNKTDTKGSPQSVPIKSDTTDSISPQPVPIKVSLHRKRRESETPYNPGENKPDDKPSEQTIKENPKGNKWSAERKKAMSERMKRIWEKRREEGRKGKA
uniref:Uncharacterized protein n=1 Tax=Cacopsylla melanoneura TaxID=428564 RepID=A0A8D8Z7X8_9HEMI